MLWQPPAALMVWTSRRDGDDRPGCSGDTEGGLDSLAPEAAVPLVCIGEPLLCPRLEANLAGARERVKNNPGFLFGILLVDGR